MNTQAQNQTFGWANDFSSKGYKDKMYEAHKKLFDVDKEVDENLFQKSVSTIENKLNELIAKESKKTANSTLMQELLEHKSMLETMPEKIEDLKQTYQHSLKDMNETSSALKDTIHSFALEHHGQTVQVFEQISTTILDYLPSHEQEEIFDALAHIESYEAHHWNKNINFPSPARF